jgi:leucyl aminopeptidase (aminopeptidase T)
LAVGVIFFENVGQNNGELPADGYQVTADALSDPAQWAERLPDAAALAEATGSASDGVDAQAGGAAAAKASEGVDAQAGGAAAAKASEGVDAQAGGAAAAKASGLRRRSFAEIFEEQDILLAPTQFSATAPLKLAAGLHGFRAATMPGFNAEMIPTLKLDYSEIGARVEKLAALLDDAQEARLVFNVKHNAALHLTLDLRFREAHRSGGVFRRAGRVGNLPSGEAYIVPYEGERSAEPSRSEGKLPVQFGNEVVIYEVVRNRAVAVISQGGESTRESQKLAAEPAYGNMAELGLGVLADFGLEPEGEILIDEKLGLHIAFGRSDHFGGQVGVADFNDSGKVVHIDRVYLKQVQPQIAVLAVDLVAGDGAVKPLMRNGAYVIDFGID